MFAMLIPLLNTVLGPVLDNLFPDPVKRAEAQNQMTLAILASQDKLTAAAGDIIKTEAASGFWLTANWRPLLMLVFTTIIANNYILAPYVEIFFHVKVVLVLEPEFWSLLNIGVGGYVVGRSAEKGIDLWKNGSKS